MVLQPRPTGWPVGDARETRLPHFTVEYSANMAHDPQALAQVIADAALETGLFPLGGLRVRMVACDDYVIADGHDDNAFVAILARIGAGREEAVKREAASHVFEAAREFFADDLDGGYFMLSLDLIENDANCSFKANGVHARLKREMS